jgi:phage gp16-like protein
MTPLARVHVQNKQLGLDEDSARDLYELATGKRSLRAMSGAELQLVIDAQEQRGAGAVQRGVKSGLKGPYAKKLQALWIAAWNLGIVQDRRDAAMLAFVKRQTGIDHTAFLRDPADARKAVEALKSWIGRDGGVEWGNTNGHDYRIQDGGKIAWAQFRKIIPGATEIGNGRQFYADVWRALGREPHPAGLGTLKPADWRTVMNALGEQIRHAKKSSAEKGDTFETASRSLPSQGARA